MDRKQTGRERERERGRGKQSFFPSFSLSFPSIILFLSWMGWNWYLEMRTGMVEVPGIGRHSRSGCLKSKGSLGSTYKPCVILSCMLELLFSSGIMRWPLQGDGRVGWRRSKAAAGRRPPQHLKENNCYDALAMRFLANPNAAAFSASQKK